MEEAHKASLRAFAAWFAKEWTITREQWKRDFAQPPPKGDYFDGYNAGVASAPDAVEAFLGDFHGGT